MFIVMAAMSLIVAFAALWLASDARKSVDGLTDEFMNTHIKAVRIKIAENNRKINDLALQLSKLAKALKADEAGRAESEKSFTAINAELQKLRVELDQLDQSIPPRYRLSVTPRKTGNAGPSAHT